MSNDFDDELTCRDMPSRSLLLFRKIHKYDGVDNDQLYKCLWTFDPLSRLKYLIAELHWLALYIHLKLRCSSFQYDLMPLEYLHLCVLGNCLEQSS